MRVSPVEFILHKMREYERSSSVRIHEFLKQYTLHDAVIEAMSYFPEQEKLVLEIEVCNAEGHLPPFVETSLDPVPVKLVFEGVSRLIGDLNSFIDGDEINTVRYFPSHEPQKGIVDLIILTNGEARNDIKMLQIEAEEIYWVVE